MRRILLVVATMAAAVLLASGVALATGPIKINDATLDPTTQEVIPGTATPYPSEITVSGLGSTISDVDLQLKGFSHTYPDDVEMLLVGPAGQNAIVMADVGGSIPARNITLDLDDEAAIALPNEGPLTSGRFRFESPPPIASFPSPAPVPSGETALSAFDFTNPNGTCQLYIADDSPADKGRLRGWALEIMATS